MARLVLLRRAILLGPVCFLVLPLTATKASAWATLPGPAGGEDAVEVVATQAGWFAATGGGAFFEGFGVRSRAGPTVARWALCPARTAPRL